MLEVRRSRFCQEEPVLSGGAGSVRRSRFCQEAVDRVRRCVRGWQQEEAGLNQAVEHMRAGFPSCVKQI